MAELTAAGAIAFTDDGRPVAAAGMMRRALAYSAVADRPLALHCEEPTLSPPGQMHEGAVSAELGWPAGPPSPRASWSSAILARRVRGAPGSPPAPLGTCVGRRGQAGAGRSGCRVRPRRTRITCAPRTRTSYARRQREDEPAASHEDDRRALVEGLLDGTIDCVATDHAPHARQEKDVPFEEAPFGVTGLETAFGALNTFLVRTGEISLPTLLDRLSAGLRARSGCPCRGSRWGSPPTSSCSTSRRSGRCARRASARARRTHGFWGGRSSARSSRRSPTVGWCSPREGR